jgi:hypothetical protein
VVSGDAMMWLTFPPALVASIIQHAIVPSTFPPVLAVCIFPPVLAVMKESFPQPFHVIHRAYALISSKCCTFHTALVTSVICTKTTIATISIEKSNTFLAHGRTCGFHDLVDVSTCTYCQHLSNVQLLPLPSHLCLMSLFVHLNLLS